ncbi:MAG: hypothetical protein WCR51_02175 [Planctomycetia bacterium]
MRLSRCSVVLLCTALILSAQIGRPAERTQQPADGGVFVLRAAPPGAKAAGGGPAHGGLLVRELVRQAVLISARDELGLVTRDASLGDQIDPKDETAVTIRTTADAVGAVRYELVFGGDGSGGTKHSDSVSFKPVDGLVDYTGLAAALERQSREILPAVLRKAGFTASATHANRGVGDDAVLPPGPARFSPLAQLAEVRRLHDVMRRHGESDEVLDRLAAGYANLAMLTEKVWSTQPTVYAARALLYAQRLVATQPQAARGQWRMAYVLDMLGADRLAIEALTQADKATAAAGSTPPAWSSLVTARVQYDPIVLARLAAEPEADELTRVQLYRSLPGDWSFNRPSGVIALDFVSTRHGACTPIVRRLATGPDIGPLHVGVKAEEEALQEDVTAFVNEWQAVSDEVAKQVNAAAKPGKAGAKDPLTFVPQALVSVGEKNDPAEPSNRAVGRLMMELNMLSGHDQILFMWGMLGLPFEQYEPEAKRRLAAVGKHELGRMVYLAAMRQGVNVEYLQKYFGGLNLRDARTSVAAVTKPLVGVVVKDRDIGREIAARVRFHADDLAGDQLELTRLADPAEAREAATRWLVVCPNRPAAELMARWPTADEPLPHEEVLARWLGHPETTNAVIERLIARNDIDRALAALEEASAKQHDAWQYLTLIDLHRARGQHDDWKRVLDEFISHPDDGIAVHKARADYAVHLMAAGDFAGALPHAEAAAESYSGDGLLALAICKEGLGKPAEALEIQQKIAERYPRSAMEWYLACVRLGAGDRATAREAVLKTHALYDTPAQPYRPIEIAIIEQCEGRPAAAAAAWEASLAKPLTAGNAGDALMAALLYDEAKQPADRDRLLGLAREASQAAGADTVNARMVEIVSKEVQRRGSLTATNAKALLAPLPPDDKAVVALHLGLWLARAGKRDVAAAILRPVAERVAQRALLATLAADAIRKLKEPSARERSAKESSDK